MSIHENLQFNESTFEQGVDDLPTIALVCVHGIGTQLPGRTARDVAASVKLGAAESGFGFLDLGSGGRGSTAEVRALLEVPGRGAYVVEFHDCWWDKLVDPPSKDRVLRWVARVTPITLLVTAAAWNAELDNIEQQRSGAVSAWRVMPGLLVGMASIPLAVLATVVAWTVYLASFLSRRGWLPKWEWLTQAEARAAEVAELTIGDAWYYRSEQLDDTVLASIRRTVGALKESCDVVFLVGHSQGAELSRRVAVEESVDGCVWIGSGEVPLGLLRTLRRSPALPLVLLVVGIVFPALFDLFATANWNMTVLSLKQLRDLAELLSGAPPLHPTGFKEILLSLPSYAASAVAFLVPVCGAAWLIRLAARHPDDALRQPECEIMVVKSLFDPVCVGPTAANSIVRYVPVAEGRKQWRKEHVTYFDKPQTGVAILEGLFGTEVVMPKLHLPSFRMRVYFVSAVSTVIIIGSTWLLGHWMVTLVGKWI